MVDLDTKQVIPPSSDPLFPPPPFAPYDALRAALRAIFRGTSAVASQAPTGSSLPQTSGSSGSLAVPVSVSPRSLSALPAGALIGGSRGGAGGAVPAASPPPSPVLPSRVSTGRLSPRSGTPNPVDSSASRPIASAFLAFFNALCQLHKWNAALGMEGMYLANPREWVTALLQLAPPEARFARSILEGSQLHILMQKRMKETIQKRMFAAIRAINVKQVQHSSSPALCCICIELL